MLLRLFQPYPHVFGAPAPVLRVFCPQLKVIHKESVSSSPISCLAITPDDAYVYLGCWDQQIVTFSVRTWCIVSSWAVQIRAQRYRLVVQCPS